MTLEFLRYSLPMLMPLAVGWVERQERAILAAGVPLSPKLIEGARSLGVTDPERVRVKSVETVPWPGNRLLQRAGEIMGLRTSCTAGLCARYGIYVQNSFANNDEVLLHELVHTVQYERLGGIRAFLDQYLRECMEYGYASSPMEIEAREMACMRDGFEAALVTT